MSKRCFKCGDVKPLSDFYVHSQMADGHLNKCKSCAKKDVAAHSIKNREKIQKYNRDRGCLPERVAARKSYAQSESGRLALNEGRKRYLGRNPDKRRAHNLLKKAIVRGEVVRLPCAVCGESVGIEGHHHDYSLPLDVTWLCQKHHVEEHKRLRALLRAA